MEYVGPFVTSLTVMHNAFLFRETDNNFVEFVVFLYSLDVIVYFWIP